MSPKRVEANHKLGTFHVTGNQDQTGSHNLDPTHNEIGHNKLGRLDNPEFDRDWPKQNDQLMTFGRDHFESSNSRHDFYSSGGGGFNKIRHIPDRGFERPEIINDFGSGSGSGMHVHVHEHEHAPGDHGEHHDDPIVPGPPEGRREDDASWIGHGPDPGRRWHSEPSHPEENDRIISEHPDMRHVRPDIDDLVYRQYDAQPAIDNLLKEVNDLEEQAFEMVPQEQRIGMLEEDTNSLETMLDKGKERIHLRRPMVGDNNYQDHKCKVRYVPAKNCHCRRGDGGGRSGLLPPGSPPMCTPCETSISPDNIGTMDPSSERPFSPYTFWPPTGQPPFGGGGETGSGDGINMDFFTEFCKKLIRSIQDNFQKIWDAINNGNGNATEQPEKETTASLAMDESNSTIESTVTTTMEAKKDSSTTSGSEEDPSGEETTTKEPVEGKKSGIKSKEDDEDGDKSEGKEEKKESTKSKTKTTKTKSRTQSSSRVVYDEDSEEYDSEEEEEEEDAIVKSARVVKKPMKTKNNLIKRKFVKLPSFRH